VDLGRELGCVEEVEGGGVGVVMVEDGEGFDCADGGVREEEGVQGVHV